MNNFDSSLLSRFQKLSDFFQLYLGINNFNLAKVFLTAAFTFFMFYNVKMFWWRPAISIISIAAGLWFYFYITSKIKNGERNCSQNNIFKSNLSVELSLFRELSVLNFIVGIIFIVYDWYGVYNMNETNELYGEAVRNLYYRKSFLIVSFSECLALYFASCTPKPKAPSKLKNLLEKTFTNPKLQTQNV